MHTHPTDPATRAAAEHAAALLEQADALIVAAGAGMGVDSGLPDFRGATKGSGVPTLRWRRRGWTLPPSLRPQRFVGRPNWPGAFTATGWRCTAARCPTRALRNCSAGARACTRA